MAPLFQRPENALKRSEELLAVGQSAAALQTLTNALMNKKAASSGTDVVWTVIKKVIELAVEQRKSTVLRESLQLFRNMTQNTNIELIEKAVGYTLQLAEEKVKLARKTADKIALEAIEDLEEMETPESMLLSVVSAEQSKDRTDRAVVTPWLKFLWENFRNMVDLLKNNLKLEKLYQDISRQAIQFCLEYQRKAEYQKLSEMLRTHLQFAVKGPQQQHKVNLNDADTIQRFMDTRFYQLKVATDMELWQESFKVIEDIHNLIVQTRRTVKVAALADYYDKLARNTGKDSWCGGVATGSRQCAFEYTFGANCSSPARTVIIEDSSIQSNKEAYIIVAFADTTNQSIIDQKSGAAECVGERTCRAKTAVLFAGEAVPPIVDMQVACTNSARPCGPTCR
ncbi:Eukaryotic translation initiation factor 3 subunit A [Zancudomyces culisetae]|uniref:Eukaryotic translation initiation factor 3 subunit A n=1 Tax=Zancudomyces culisetae TaxID=1213189 RepID=A0A1R1PEP6_ZANCU|nr:Eukaryotic translation initiation factor 3 subunit A [Zancudomyces culisetae]|eukprot:OMH79447.1 Eukaryotic translation initiation factor 3 subunit A [Zancudomyces culisetae]